MDRGISVVGLAMENTSENLGAVWRNSQPWF